MEAHNNELLVRLQKLTNETCYPIIQLHGQRKFGPPPGWNAPPPQRGCEVFVGRIPREIYEDELVPVLSRHGKIYELRLMMDFSGTNRGYGFVTYTNRSNAIKTIRELNDYEIVPGRHIAVVKSMDKCRLHVGNIPPTKTKEDVFEELSKWVACIVNVTLYKNSFDDRMKNTLAFVKFKSHRAAAIARRTLVGCINLWDQEVMVDWAEPDPYGDDEDMTRICSGFEKKNRRKYLKYPNKLQCICHRHDWAPPIYEYQRYTDDAGNELWMSSVKLPYVGLPLLPYPRSIFLLATKPTHSMRQAHAEAASTALQYLEKQANILRSGMHAVHKEAVQPIPTNYSPYDYAGAQSTIWGAP